VAFRYFNTEARKFIIGDTPGHEQYTRNMVTAASNADAAVVLVDATKLDWQDPHLHLLPQTRRHSLLLKLLRVPSVVFAINKLDAVQNAQVAFQNIQAALAKFAQEAGISVQAWVPLSALKGWNVVESQANWCGYNGPSLLQILENLPSTPADFNLDMSFPVQWVEKFHETNVTHRGRRVFWGRVATGTLRVGQSVKVFPSGQIALVAQVLSDTRQEKTNITGQSAGLVLDREVDVSRGDWILAADSDMEGQRQIDATVAWMDEEPLLAGRLYWALHGHRWVKAKVQRIVHRLNINTLVQEEATELPANSVGQITLTFQEPLIALPFAKSRVLGALILVDTASHKTSGAVLVN
jgi:sulfate adenylyltransferase subunit 1